MHELLSSSTLLWLKLTQPQRISSPLELEQLFESVTRNIAALNVDISEFCLTSRNIQDLATHGAKFQAFSLNPRIGDNISTDPDALLEAL